MSALTWTGETASLVYGVMWWWGPDQVRNSGELVLTFEAIRGDLSLVDGRWWA